MKYGVLPKLTKNYVLERINQEDIFAHYFNISTGEIDSIVNTTTRISNPLRTDKNPSLGFRYAGNRLRAKDFAGHFWGDCFDLVGMLLRENPNTKLGFMNVLERIAEDFRLHKYANQSTINKYVVDKKNTTKKKIKFDIQYQKRQWNKYDAIYWRQFNITRKILEKFNVFACEYVWVNGDLRYQYNPNNPAYIYDFGNSNIKVYYPFRKKFRFITNTNVIQGVDLILPDRFGIITKSYKDVMTLASFNIQAVAPSSETHLITKDQYFRIRNNFDYTASLMDYDRTGKVMALKLRKLYGIQPMFTRYTADGRFLDHNAKDISELVSLKGVKYTQGFIDSTIDYYEEQIEEQEQELNDF